MTVRPDRVKCHCRSSRLLLCAVQLCLELVLARLYRLELLKRLQTRMSMRWVHAMGGYRHSDLQVGRSAGELSSHFVHVGTQLALILIAS